MKHDDDFDPDEQIERERQLRWARRDASPIPLNELERAERDYYTNRHTPGLWTMAGPTVIASLFSPWWLLFMPFVTLAIMFVGLLAGKIVARLFDPNGDAPLWSIAWGLGIANLLLDYLVYFYADVLWSDAAWLAGGLVGCIACLPFAVLGAHIRMSQPRPRYLQLLDEMRGDPPEIIE